MILTQRDPGGAGVGVDPEGQPGEDDDEQRRGVNTHHVEADLSPQGEDDLHTRVVACARNETTVSQSHATKSAEQEELFIIDNLDWIDFLKMPGEMRLLMPHQTLKAFFFLD